MLGPQGLLPLRTRADLRIESERLDSCECKLRLRHGIPDLLQQMSPENEATGDADYLGWRPE